MAEIRHLKNRHDVIFSCRGWSDLDTISQTGAEWHVDCGDMTEMETRSRIPIWLACHPEPPATLQGAATWWIQWHVIPEPCVALQGAVTWRNQSSMSWSCHIAGCKNSIRHIENRFSPYFILFFFGFRNAVLALTSGGFRIISDTLVWI